MTPRKAVDGLESELRDHIERDVEENIERGMSPQRARAAALRKFGSIALVREDVRAVWVPVWVDQLGQDVRSGLRMLRRHRSFAAAAVLSIALGIAGSAVIFGLLDGLIFHPFALPDPDRVVAIGATFPKLSSGEQFVETLSPAEFQDIAASASLQHVLAFDLGNRNISGGDRPERVFTGLALSDPFGPFALRPALGRGFTPEELAANGPAVAILSHRIWQSRFASDPSLVGRTIRVNGRPTVVVGVMPPELLVLGVDLWLPWAAAPASVPRNVRQFTIIGRLADKASLDRANAELSTLAARTNSQYGGQFAEYGGWHLRAVPWAEAITSESRPVGRMLLVAVALLMLIACANVSNLLLTHATTRRAEGAVRVAIGASRSRLARQLVTEVIVLAVIGASIGLAIGSVALPTMMRLIPEHLNTIGLNASLNGRVLLWSASLTVGCAILSALLPVLMTLRTEPQEALKGDSRGTTSGHFAIRLRRSLIIGEIGLAVALLCGAALLTRSSLNIGAIHPGFDIDNLLTMRLTLPTEKYRGIAVSTFFEQLVERVRAVPGVRAAAVASQFPPTTTLTTQFQPETVAVQGATLLTAAMTVASDELFTTLGVPIVSGRSFNQRDRGDTAHVVIVNETFADRYLPGVNPVGQRLTMGPPDRRSEPATVVGVVRDVKNRGVRVAATPELFVPVRQLPAYNQLFLIVRTDGEPVSVLGALRREIAAIDADQPIYAVQTMSEAFTDAEFRQRASLIVLTAFALVGLILGAVGIYGVVAYGVATRRKEFGVRMSLGADARAIRALVLGDGARLIGAGVVAGLLLMIAAARAMRGYLFGVTPTDPVALAVVSAVVVGVGLLACAVPTRRATSIDPNVALRAEL